jgi:hypothetical protein
MIKMKLKDFEKIIYGERVLIAMHTSAEEGEAIIFDSVMKSVYAFELFGEYEVIKISVNNSILYITLLYDKD